jgi:transcriptional regulator with XRE-family HTH domain
MSSTRTKGSATKARILRKLSEQMAEIQRSEVCQRIAQARRESGMTQEEIADALDITTRAYQAYEADRVPWRRLDQIAELTGVTRSWLLHGSDTPPDPLPPGSDLLEAIRELTDELRRRRLDDGEAGSGTP